MVVTPELTTLEPYELMDLLGIDRAKAGLFTTAPFRIKTDWVEKWRNRRGALELKPAEVAFLVGRNVATVTRWCNGIGGKLVARASGHYWRISPAALVACLEAMSGPPPTIVETPIQRDRRAQADKEAARAVLGTGRRKPKAA